MGKGIDADIKNELDLQDILARFLAYDIKKDYFTNMSHDQILFESRIVKYEKERLKHIVECLNLLYDHEKEEINFRLKNHLFETEKKLQHSAKNITIKNNDLDLPFPHIDKKGASTTKNHLPNKDQVRDNSNDKASKRGFLKPTPPSIPNVKLNVEKAKKYIDDLEKFDTSKKRKSIKKVKRGFTNFDMFANTERSCSNSNKSFDPKNYLIMKDI